MAVFQDFYFQNVTDLAHTLLFADSAFNHRSTSSPCLSILLAFWSPKRKTQLVSMTFKFPRWVLCLFLQAYLFYIPHSYPLSQPFHFSSCNSEPTRLSEPPVLFHTCLEWSPFPTINLSKTTSSFKTCLDVNCWTLCPFLISNCNHCLFSSISVLASKYTVNSLKESTSRFIFESRCLIQCLPGNRCLVDRYY